MRKTEAREVYLFLKKRYRTWKNVAVVTMIPLSTIEKHLRNAGGSVSLKNQEKLRKIYRLYTRG